MSLRTALEKAQLIWNAQQKHPAHIETVMHTIGYKKKTGPSLRAISALNQYGLTKETGSVDKRVIGLSDLAINYLLSSDAAERAELLRQAALRPTVFQHLWQQYGAFLPPSDDALKSHLIREKNFNSAAVGELVANYRDTFDFANLGGNGGSREEKSDKGEGKATVNPPPYKPPTPQPKGTPPMSANVRYLPIPLDIGDAPIPVGMSEDDFELLKKTLDLWKSKIVRPPDSKADQQKERQQDDIGRFGGQP